MRFLYIKKIDNIGNINDGNRNSQNYKSNLWNDYIRNYVTIRM
jgi:hypothetical protein